MNQSSIYGGRMNQEETNIFNSKWLISQFENNQSLFDTKNISSIMLFSLNQIAFLFHWVNEFNLDMKKQESYSRIRHRVIKEYNKEIPQEDEISI